MSQNGIPTANGLEVRVYAGISHQSALNRTRARLEAAGKKLTFREILGPGIPPGQNAGAAAVFAPFFDYETRPIKTVPIKGGEARHTGGLVWGQSNQLVQLEGAFIMPANYLPDPTEGSPRAPNTPVIDLAKWSAAFRAAATLKLAVMACALERYRLANGEFPGNLNQLTPKHGPIPPDPMVNQPFHYHHTDDGWFLLYSVGLNGQDDGGRMVSDRKNDKEEKDWPWPAPTRPESRRLF